MTIAPSSIPLSPGERIVWTGAPPGGLLFRPLDLVLVPFSLLWAGFAAYWEIGAWSTGDWLFRLWGVPFLLVGAYAVFGRFLVDRWVRRRLRYVVTDRRIVVQRLGPAGSLRTLDLRHLPPLATDERPDGSGTISFGALQAVWGWRPGGGLGRGLAVWSPALEPTPQFYRIEGVAAVGDLIQRAAAATAPPR